MKVLMLIGSLRAASWNRKLAAAYAALNGGIGIAGGNVLFEEGIFSGFPLYSEDIQAKGFPADVLKLGEQIRAADAVLFISPEYNYSVPGALKNALDWISRLPSQPFAGKPCSVIGASPGRLGTARMQYHLRQIAVFLDMRMLNKPEVMVGAAPSVFDTDGVLKDEATASVLKAHFNALRTFAT